MPDEPNLAQQLNALRGPPPPSQDYAAFGKACAKILTGYPRLDHMSGTTPQRFIAAIE